MCTLDIYIIHVRVVYTQRLTHPLIDSQCKTFGADVLSRYTHLFQTNLLIMNELGSGLTLIVYESIETDQETKMLELTTRNVESNVIGV